MAFCGNLKSAYQLDPKHIEEQEEGKQNQYVEDLRKTDTTQMAQCVSPEQIDQVNEYSEVHEFLMPIKLDKYLSKFVENGVEDLETILEL